ncbi:hypothetical protein B4135_2333 [Caldibacillus debilis]|uniref:Uncharacterized protein n=1 Tax=Caldibacillus debilis TaxID=301148 RepID=A0A150M1T6_9BACI|nr:hypothetical protein B4135_2333 [Caldibacillus debilis]
MRERRRSSVEGITKHKRGWKGSESSEKWGPSLAEYRNG